MVTCHEKQWLLAMNKRDNSASGSVWQQLEDHFRAQAQLLQRFAQATPSAVVHMWTAGTNELGEPLSAFEREALVERHCLLFGHWPT
jgi:hypothetical protein